MSARDDDDNKKLALSVSRPKDTVDTLVLRACDTIRAFDGRAPFGTPPGKIIDALQGNVDLVRDSPNSWNS